MTETTTPTTADRAAYFGSACMTAMEDPGASWADAELAYTLARKAAHYAAKTLPAVPARIRIIADDTPESPRDWDNLGTMYCEHRRYALGDKDADDPREIPEKEIAVMLGLWLYDHSGITIRTGGLTRSGNPFHCPWDSGQVGVIYVTVARLIEEYGADTPEHRAAAETVLKGEVEVYDQYLRGDVYGFVVEDHTGETLDSCWGFYGTDWKTNGMLDHWDAETRQLAEEEGVGEVEYPR